MEETALDSFRQEIVLDNDLVVWRISGTLDFLHYDALKTELGRLVDNRARFIVFDLQGLDSIDSRGLSFLVTAQRDIRGIQGRVVLINLSAKFASLFEMTRFNRIFEIFLDMESAQRSFGSFRGSRDVQAPIPPHPAPAPPRSDTAGP